MVVLYAVDPIHVAPFYEAVAGFTRGESSAGYVLLQTGSEEIDIVRVSAEIAEGIVLSDPPEPREDNPIKPTFNVESIEAARAAAVGTGGEIYPVEHEWEFRDHIVCNGVDPEGNVIQVRQR